MRNKALLLGHLIRWLLSKRPLFIVVYVTYPVQVKDMHGLMIVKVPYLHKGKIDKAMANHAGMNFLPGSTYLVLPTIKSDHSSLVISFEKDQTPIGRRPYIFRYEAFWELKADCTKIIQEAWEFNNTLGQRRHILINKLKKCKQALIQWRKKFNKQEQQAGK